MLVGSNYQQPCSLKPLMERAGNHLLHGWGQMGEYHVPAENYVERVFGQYVANVLPGPPNILAVLRGKAPPASFEPESLQQPFSRKFDERARRVAGFLGPIENDGVDVGGQDLEGHAGDPLLHI